MPLTHFSLFEAAQQNDILETNVDGLEIYHDDKTEVGKQIYHTFFVEHPKLGNKRIYINTIQHRDSKWRGEIEVGGNDPNKLGVAAVRHVMRHIRQTTGINQFGGERETGAGRGRFQQIDFLKEASGKAELTKGKVDRGRFEKSPNMPASEWEDHHYRLYHPALDRNVGIIATKDTRFPGTASVTIVGNKADANKVGTVDMRAIARQISSDLGVKIYTGLRTTGARVNTGKGPLRTSVPIKESEDDPYDTKDLEEFSQHLREKHGGHVDLYWTREGHINLQTLIVPKELRGQGIASAMISDIKHYSKVHNRKIILNAVPLDKSTKGKKLIKFYKSHGFVENKGRNKDYALGGFAQSNTMWQNPFTKKKKVDTHATA